MLSQASLRRDWLARRWVARCASAAARSAGVSGGGASVFLRSLGLRGRGGGRGGCAGGIFLPSYGCLDLQGLLFCGGEVFCLFMFTVEG